MRVFKALVLSFPALTMTLGGISTLVAIDSLSATKVFAAEKKEKQVSAKVGKPLKEALELAQAKKYKDAFAKLQEAQSISGRTPYDEYKINEFMSYVAANLGDSASAVKALEALLDSPESNAEDLKKHLYQLITFEYQTKNYPKAAQYGARYLKDVGPDLNIALLISQSYYLQKDYPQAITAIQSLESMAQQAGQPIQKDWLDLLRSSQQLSNKDDDAAATLEILLAKYPSSEYWRDAFIIEQNKGRGSDRKNLEVLRLKMLTGVLKDGDYVEMAQLAMALGFPGDAKMILEKGFANKILGTGKDKDRENRLLAKAQADSAADQKDLAAFEKEAAAKPTGDADVKLGQTLASYGDTDKGIEAMKRGMKKGGLKADDEAHLMLGVAYVNAKKMSEAAAEFKAVPSDSKLASIAHLWAIYAKSKS